MKHKYFLTGYSLIIVIGVCCASLGFCSSIDYLYGNGDLGRWIGKTTMAFSTSVALFWIGVALFLTGKYLIHHDKTI